MCVLAHFRKDFVCTLAECARAASCALSGAMSKPKSEAVQIYRNQIAVYVDKVRLATGWKNVEMGKRAGGLAHTTIGRALKGEHTMGFPALMALEEASGVPIPNELRQAAIAAQQPWKPGPSADDLRQVAASLLERPPEEKRALLEALQRDLAKAR